MTRVERNFVRSLQAGLRERVRAYPELERECLARWSREERSRRLAWYFLKLPRLVGGLLAGLAISIGLPLFLALPVILPRMEDVAAGNAIQDPVIFLAVSSSFLACLISWSQLILLESRQSVTSEWYFPKKNRNRWIPWHVFWFAIPLLIFTVATWGSLVIRAELSMPKGLIGVGLMVVQSLWIPVLMGLWLGMVRGVASVGFALVGLMALVPTASAIKLEVLEVELVAWLLLQPTGWVAAMFQNGVMEGRPVAWLLAVPVAGGFVVAARWLRQGLTIHDIQLHGSGTMAGQAHVTYAFGMLKPSDGPMQSRRWKWNPLWKREEPLEEIRDLLERRESREQETVGEQERDRSDLRFPRECLEQHLSADGHGEYWNRWDRWILTRFSARERHILRLVHGDWPSVSRATLTFAVFLGIWILFVYLIGVELDLAGEAFPAYLLYVGGALFCCWFAWVPWGRHFASNAPPPGLIPSNLPIGYREWNRLNLRWTSLALPALLLNVAVASPILASMLEINIWTLFDLGGRPLLIFVIWTPFRSLSAISWPTELFNEWQRFWHVGLPRVLLLTWLVLLTFPLAWRRIVMECGYRFWKLSCPLAAGIVIVLSSASIGDARDSDRPPNVVLIFTDDQGTVDMNIYGADDLTTPHMDSIALRGVRFTQFYAAAPVCSPSRAGLLTGRFPLRAGVPGNVSSMEGEAGMPVDQMTIADMLRAAGYATAHIGKWHLGYTPETMPNAQGFEFSFGHMGGCIDNWSHFFYWQGPNRHDLHRNGRRIYRDGEYFPELMVEEAESFMRQHQDRPFFLYFAMNAPHYPYQGHARWLKHYQDLEYPRNLYAAFLSTQDEYIGRLMKVVEELGLNDDTIVVFQSDHGHSLEERAHFGGGSAGPYRGAKFSMFEGGIRVPAAIAWPGRVPVGEVRGQVAHSCDWLPTIAELCQVPLLDDDVDGTSLVDLIRSADAPAPDRVLHWQTGRGPNASWAVRQGDWKLLGNPRDPTDKAPLTDADRLFLVNLADDASEMTNLADRHRDVAERLEQLHEAWLGGLE